MLVEGMEGQPTHLIDWKGKDWTPPVKKLPRTPIPLYTPAAQCRLFLPTGKNRKLAIDIFIFGGRRSGVVPLVTEAFDWDHGVFMGATAASEPTALYWIM